MLTRAIVFDAYGTLFDVNSVINVCEKVYPGHGRLINQIWRQKQLEHTWLRALMHKYVDFESVTRNALQFALNQLNLTSSSRTIEELFSSYLNLKPFPEVNQALRDLHKSVRLSVLSNGTARMLHDVIEHANVSSYFDKLLSVDMVSTYKPDPRVYELAMKEIGASSKAEILFVSSNQWDAAGSKAFGFKTVWLNRTGSQLNELPEFSPDHVLSALSQLPSILAQNCTS